MTLLVMFLALLCAFGCSQEAPSVARVSAVTSRSQPQPAGDLEWIELRNCYAPDGPIRAVVRNRSDRPIYLNWMYPEPAGHLHRYAENERRWLAGRRGYRCGLVEDAGTPREVKPAESFEFEAYGALTERDGQMVFHQGGALTHPAEGLYKMSLSYAREPWTNGRTPASILETRSRTFRVSSDCGPGR